MNKNPFKTIFSEEIFLALCIALAAWFSGSESIDSTTSVLKGISIFFILRLAFLGFRKLGRSTGVGALMETLQSAPSESSSQARGPIGPPIPEQTTRALMHYLGRNDQGRGAIWFYLFALLVISLAIALLLFRVETQQSALMPLALWGCLIGLPLLGGYVPQTAEAALQKRLRLRGQRIAMHLEKIFGAYIASFLSVVVVTLGALLLSYVEGWSILPPLGKIALWVLAQWLIFIASFLGAVIAIEYCNNRLKRRTKDILPFTFTMLLLAVTFPLLCYPILGLAILLTKDWWQSPTIGLLTIGLALACFSLQLSKDAQTSNYSKQ